MNFEKEKTAKEITNKLLPDIRICILQRGWIYIGKFIRVKNDCFLQDASIIRNWGTSKGLGELVNGPTQNTKLDKCFGEIEFHWLTCINTIKVKSEAWTKHLE